MLDTLESASPGSRTEATHWLSSSFSEFPPVFARMRHATAG